jgi:putative endonuclease
MAEDRFSGSFDLRSSGYAGTRATLKMTSLKFFAQTVPLPTFSGYWLTDKLSLPWGPLPFGKLRVGVKSMSGTLTRCALRALDSLAFLLPKKKAGPRHLRTGRRGEEEAYFYLRRKGYVMVARNYRSPRCRSELDLVGWEGGTLCFIEVKTRGARGMVPAEAAVDPEKQRDLSRVAREFLRKVKGEPAIRFDVVSVYFAAGKAEIELFQDAFRMV